MDSPGKRLRALINAPDILVLPGVFDGFSTRLVRKHGYQAAFITGSGISESRLGQSDVGIMGMEENVAAARAIAACTDMLLKKAANSPASRKFLEDAGEEVLIARAPRCATASIASMKRWARSPRR